MIYELWWLRTIFLRHCYQNPIYFLQNQLTPQKMKNMNCYKHPERCLKLNHGVINKQEFYLV